MKKTRKSIVYAVLLSVFVLCLAACGTSVPISSSTSSISGTYYYIGKLKNDTLILPATDDAEHWIEFDNVSLNTNTALVANHYCNFYLGGTPFEYGYSLQGNQITIDRTYSVEGTTYTEETITGDMSDDRDVIYLDYNGETWVFSEFGYIPSYLETFDPEYATVFTLQQALDNIDPYNGNYYVKQDDNYYPLTEAYSPFNRFSNVTDRTSAITASSLNIPIISNQSNLVLFSEKSIDQVEIIKFNQHGYTIPLLLYDGNSRYSDDGISIEDFLFYTNREPLIDKQLNRLGYNSASNGIFKLDQENDLLRENSVQEINGIPIQDYSDDYVYVRDSYFLLDCAPSQEISTAYLLGSMWHETSFPAVVEYWTNQNDDAWIRLTPQATKNGYYLIDTSELESGTYAVVYRSSDRLIFNVE